MFVVLLLCLVVPLMQCNYLVWEEGWLFSLICGLCTVRLGLFVFLFGDIGRLCFSCIYLVLCQFYKETPFMT